MVTEFLIKYWELLIIGFLVLNLIIQKIEKIKGRSDVLTWIWQFLTWIVSLIRQIVTMLFSTTPGKLPMLFIGFLLMSFLLVSSAITSTNMTFEWDANTEPDLAGYRLYQSDTSGIYTFGSGNEVASIPAGTEVVTLPNLPDGTYYWVATAFDTGGQESGPSNEITETLDAPPGCPINLRRMF